MLIGNAPSTPNTRPEFATDDGKNSSWIWWAQWVINSHKKGCSPIWTNEVATAGLILLGILTDANEIKKHRELPPP